MTKDASKCAFTPQSGRKFAGWLGDNGNRYDDGVLIFQRGAGRLVADPDRDLGVGIVV